MKKGTALIVAVYLGLLLNILFVSGVILLPKENPLFSIYTYAIAMVLWVAYFVVVTIVSVVRTSKFLFENKIEELRQLTRIAKFWSLPYFIISSQFKSEVRKNMI